MLSCETVDWCVFKLNISPHGVRSLRQYAGVFNWCELDVRY